MAYLVVNGIGSNSSRRAHRALVSQPRTRWQPRRCRVHMQRSTTPPLLGCVVRRLGRSRWSVSQSFSQAASSPAAVGIRFLRAPAIRFGPRFWRICEDKQLVGGQDWFLMPRQRAPVKLPRRVSLLSLFSLFVCSDGNQESSSWLAMTLDTDVCCAFLNQVKPFSRQRGPSQSGWAVVAMSSSTGYMARGDDCKAGGRLRRWDAAISRLWWMGLTSF